MSALLVALLLSQAAGVEKPARKLETEVAFAYGYGSRMSFGLTANAAMSWRVCNFGGLECRVRAGVLGGYQNEPYAVTAPFFAPSVISGSNHRVELFGTLGFATHFFSSRRLLLEIDFFTGWTGLWVDGRVQNDDAGISRAYRTSGHELTFGFSYALGVRLTDHVTLLGRFFAPIPYDGVAISSYFMATLGLRVSF
ncbi:MAG: hypothetical protein JNK82_40565 [Myxococcaceae bacterium]|nr:hypothetical protein [Myxococcaceae bacterium]